MPIRLAVLALVSICLLGGNAQATADNGEKTGRIEVSVAGLEFSFVDVYRNSVDVLFGWWKQKQLQIWTGSESEYFVAPYQDEDAADRLVEKFEDALANQQSAILILSSEKLCTARLSDPRTGISYNEPSRCWIGFKLPDDPEIYNFWLATAP